MARHISSQPNRILIAAVGLVLGVGSAAWLGRAPLSAQVAQCDNDQVCEPGEQTVSCGDCPSVCGDQICAPSEVSTCAADCPLAVTCGDQECSAFENFSNCPLDCDPPTRTPVSTPFAPSSSIPTATRIPPTRDPASTATPLPTATVTPIPPTATAAREATATFDPTESLLPETPEREAAPNCRIVPAAEIDDDIVEVFAARTQGYTALNWLICERAPTDVCLPADPVLDVSAGQLDELWLLDCAADHCEVMRATSLEDGELCHTVGLVPGDPGCAHGCAFARLPDGPLGFQLDWVSVLLIVLVVSMLGLFTLLLLRRRRAEDEEIIKIPTPRGG